MSDVRDLLVATAHDVFGRGRADVDTAIERSGLASVGEEGDLGDVAAVIRVAAYHAAADGFADRVMPGGVDAGLRGALARSIQMAGALERVRDLTVRYAAERRQFGQPLNRFQAIQQHLAALAAEVALAGAAVDDAVASPTPARVGAAKIVAGRAAGAAAAIAHQVHGAIGYTREHELHRFTTRLWRWRDEHGTEAEWAARLGERALAATPDGLWGLMTAGEVSSG